MPVVGTIMCVAQKKQAKSLSPMCWKVHQVYAGWRVSDLACTMEDQGLSQQEASGFNSGSARVGKS